MLHPHIAVSAATTSASSTESGYPPYVPFSVTPETGTVQPGKKATITVKFSPLDVTEYEGRLICRYDKHRETWNSDGHMQ